MDAADPRDPQNGETPPEPPAEGDQPAETVEHPRHDETAEQPPVDETAPAPGQPVDPWNRQAETVVGGEPVPPTEPPARPTDGSGTAVMPTVPSDEGQQPRWSARAQVAPVRGPMRQEEEEWAGPPERPPRPVLPILIAVVAVLLLVIIGLGLWLALRNRNTPTTPTTTAPPATTAPHTTPPPTTTAPPTTTPPPTTTAPVGITIPDLSGHDPGEAAKLLSSLGITLGPPQTQSSDTIPSGRVIGTSPGVGTVVLPGQPVSLIVSSGPAITPTPTTSPS